MKFIFPQNYHFSHKLFGFLDYSTAIFITIWCLLVFSLCNAFCHSLNFKIFFTIFFSFPIFLFSIIGFNHENILYVFTYLLTYFLRPKVYLYQKNSTFL